MLCCLLWSTFSIAVSETRFHIILGSNLAFISNSNAAKLAIPYVRTKHISLIARNVIRNEKLALKTLKTSKKGLWVVIGEIRNNFQSNESYRWFNWKRYFIVMLKICIQYRERCTPSHCITFYYFYYFYYYFVNFSRQTMWI